MSVAGVYRSLCFVVLSGVLAGPAAFSQQATAAPKNVILMIADGTGANPIAATGMYTGMPGKQVFDGPGWLKSSSSTYPLRTSEEPDAGPSGLMQDPDAVYDPAKNWNTAPVSTEARG